jgi:hypothetical protein
MGTAATSVMAGAGPLSRLCLRREKAWMPTFVGMTMLRRLNVRFPGGMPNDCFSGNSWA